MNVFDLIVYVVLIYAVWIGWEQGCIRQLCSLIGVVLAVGLAARFGPDLGDLCGLDGGVAAPAGFLVVLLIVLVVVTIIGRAIRRIIRFAGLGVADGLLGVAFAVVKYALLLSVLLTAFARLNDDFRFVEPHRLEQSRTFRPLRQAAERIFPVARQVRDEVRNR